MEETAKYSSFSGWGESRLELRGKYRSFQEIECQQNSREPSMMFCIPKSGQMPNCMVSFDYSD